MRELFLKVVNMSISASWLVLAVLVLRFALKRAPKWVNVLLWGIVAVRLICPFSFESAFSLIPSAETIPTQIMEQKAEAELYDTAMITIVDNPVLSEIVEVSAGTSEQMLRINFALWSIIWVLGVISLLAYTVVSYWRLRRRVSTAVLLRENIYQSETVVSPFVLGIIKPKIYLPFQIDGQSLEHVVSHELAHIRRRDHWWKPFGFLLLAIHWFNPLMWLAYVLLCRDIELACDEKVIKELGNEQRADYSQALLACSVPRRMIAACPLAFGEVGVKERVKSVLNYKKPAFWVLAAALIASVVVAVCFLTNPFSSQAVPQKLAEKPCVEISIHDLSGESNRLTIRDSGEIDYLVELIRSTTFKKTLRRFRDSPGNLAATVQLLGEEEGPNENNTIFSLTVLSSPHSQSGEYSIYTTFTDADGKRHHLVAQKPEALNEYIHLLIASEPEDATSPSSAQAIWNRLETSDPVEMLALLCKISLILWNDSIEEEPMISVPGNFGPHAVFSKVPEDADALDIAMARRAFLLMRLYPQEVFYVMWSYPDGEGNDIRREFHADEMSAILSLSSDLRVYETPASAEDVARQIRLLYLDERLFLRYAAEGNEFSPLLEEQKTAVWFTPEDIHDIEYMELVWHDGQRFTPLTGEGYEYLETRLSSAKEIGATGCPYHSVLYIHRTDGVVGKVLPAEDSCDVFLSEGKYYQFGDRANPPYYDSSEKFYNHFGTSVEELPHYTTATDTTDYYGMVTSEPAEQVEQFAAEVKSDILSGNWESLSKKIAYPIQIDGKKIENSSDFLDMGIDDTLSQKFVEAVAAESCHKMFFNAQGIMMGATGQIWIASVDVGSSQWELKVIALNGMRAGDLSAEEIAYFNELFAPIYFDKRGDPIGVNPWACFFTSYYTDIRDMDFEEFLRYFPGDGSQETEAEFEALKSVDVWPFDWVETPENMPVPIHKYPARYIDLVLKEYAGITTDDLDTSDVAYLAEYDAYYNYTSDFGPGMFTCTRGEKIGNTVYLYEELEQSTDLLILQEQNGSYQIISHQRIKGE